MIDIHSYIRTSESITHECAAKMNIYTIHSEYVDVMDAPLSLEENIIFYVSYVL